ncbi:adenylate/guanylate cyclase domain-containing protein [Labilibaculum sp.]|uniref:adenylate/guanylate cyclase domain-containing protein n=1 Tax=Labilibaculum sp. TaxID=2060723 RepID=UPI003565E53A
MPFKRQLRSIGTYFITVQLIWVVAFFFLLIFQMDEESELSVYKFNNILNVLCFGFIAGFIWGLIFKVFTSFRRFVPSYFFSLLISVFLHLSSACLLIYFMYELGDYFLLANFPISFSRLILIYQSQLFYALLAYFFIVGFLIEIFYEIDRKLGQGLLVKFLLGRYYKPKEEQRIFLFMDLKSSTYYAEKLGHFKYSRLIQDCFKDVSDAVRNNQAQIYQYIGDEVVLSWTMKKGIKNLRCLQVFYDFLNILEKRREYYQKEYGMVPIFKAGVHAGKVMVAEVGELKSEIAYHGDAINTASRIQGLCNSYNSRLLISGSLHADLCKENKIQHECNYLGEVILTGKKIPTEIYSLAVD